MAVKKKQPPRSRRPKRPTPRPRKPPPPPSKKRKGGAAHASLPHGRKPRRSPKKPAPRRNKHALQVPGKRQGALRQAPKRALSHTPEQTAGKTPGALGVASIEKKALRKKIRKHLVVTTKEERSLVEHIELRDEAIASNALEFPDQRLHKVRTALPSQGIHAGGPWSRIPRKGVSKNTFIREELTLRNLTEILFQSKNAIVKLRKRQPAYDIFASLHLTEYGLNLYASDKMTIASKDFRTEALHKTVMGFPMAGSVEAMMFIMEARLEARLREREDAGTTAIVEYINVSLFEPDPEKTIAREDMTPGGES